MFGMFALAMGRREGGKLTKFAETGTHPETFLRGGAGHAGGSAIAASARR